MDGSNIAILSWNYVCLHVLKYTKEILAITSQYLYNNDHYKSQNLVIQIFSRSQTFHLQILDFLEFLNF